MWNSLYSLLSQVAPQLFKYNREYLTLFLLFIRDHYFAAATRDDPYARLYQGDALITGVFVSVYPCMNSGESSKRLQVFLRLLKGLGDQVKNIYGDQVICDLVLHLLQRSESEVQKMCVEILSCFYGLREGEKEGSIVYDRSERSHVKDYKEQLLQMCGDKSFRDCITTFFLSAQEGMIKTEDRFEMVKVISRILYGRLLSRSKTVRSTMEARRASIIAYLSTLEEKEIHEFIRIMVSGFFTELPSSPTSEADVDRVVNELMQKNEQISLRRISGVLFLLYDVIRTMADKLKQTVHVFLLIMAYALHRVTEELKQEPAGEEEEDEEEEDANLPTYTALRRIRTLCLRRLMESVGYFPSVNYALYASYYFAPLTPLLERLPTSCRHSKKAPTLLHLAMIISCNSQLFYIFHLQPLLVQQSVRCLLDNEDLFSTGRTDKGRLRRTVIHNMLGNLSTPVVMDIIQLIENLMCINPEEDYFNMKAKDRKRLRSNQGGIQRDDEELAVMQTRVVLKGDDGPAMEEEEDGLQFLMPLMNEVLCGVQYLLAVLPNIRSNLFNRLLSIIYHITQLTAKHTVSLSVDSLQQLLLLLISFLQFSSIRDDSQDNRIRILDAADSLVPLVTTYDDAIRELSVLLMPGKRCIEAIPVRCRIVDMFATMTPHCPIFATTVPILKSLHAISSSGIGQYDFSQRGDAYDALIKTGLAAYDPCSVTFEPLLACVLRDVTDSDMMLRSTAMECLKSFVQSCAQLLQNSDDATTQSVLTMLMEKRIVDTIKYEMSVCKNDNVRRPLVSLLRDIVLLWRFRPSLGLCSDLVVLTNEANPDNDALLCLIDIKQRTRVKGLRLINQTADAIVAGSAPRLSAGTLRSIVLPLIFAYITENRKTQDAALREDCANTLGHVSRLLTWGNYLALFRKVFNMVGVWDENEV